MSTGTHSFRIQELAMPAAHHHCFDSPSLARPHSLVTLGVSFLFTEEDREQPVREKTERTFPTAEDMRAGVARKSRGNLNRNRAR